MPVIGMLIMFEETCLCASGFGLEDSGLGLEVGLWLCCQWTWYNSVKRDCIFYVIFVQ